MRFVDEVEIHVKAGNGGHGCSSFHKEKHRPRGRPDGGDGGKGGDVILIADGTNATLLDLHFRKSYRSEHGKPGRGNNQHGRNGRDLHIHVPVGTIVSDAESSRIEADLCVAGQRFVAARGGAGGRGNARLVSSLQRAPYAAESGTEGEARRLLLELKLLADVGIVGFPNSGKSTLVSRVSSAKPRIADYPFTTLVPHLGVVRCTEHSSFVIADIPGILEHASQGRGLGVRFLKHIERASVLLYLLDCADPQRPDPILAYRSLKRELGRYKLDLLRRPHIVCFNKIDLPEAQPTISHIRKRIDTLQVPACFVSALTGKGVRAMIARLGHMIDESRRSAGASG